MHGRGSSPRMRNNPSWSSRPARPSRTAPAAAQPGTRCARQPAAPGCTPARGTRGSAARTGSRGHAESAWRVVAVAVAPQVERQHPVAVRERPRRRVPEAGEMSRPVEEQDGGRIRGAPVAVVEPQTVERDEGVADRRDARHVRLQCGCFRRRLGGSGAPMIAAPLPLIR